MIIICRIYLINAFLARKHGGEYMNEMVKRIEEDHSISFSGD